VLKDGETQIRVKLDTALTLKGAGKKGETYDDIIQRLIPKRLRRKL
jgi:hypothetical protein